MKVGDKISFGSYDWQVLDIQNDRALIITEYIIEQRPYQDSLNLDEVCRYFGDSTSKLYNPRKNQRYWFERKDENNSKRIARLEANKEHS